MKFIMMIIKAVTLLVIVLHIKKVKQQQKADGVIPIWMARSLRNTSLASKGYSSYTTKA